uniref:Syntaxin 11a n=1 Tax=Stegastes partitus TaxID=144197 RepID=A0A3B5B552_9TELE
MRDRLSHLHQVQTDSEGFSTVELDTFEHEAAAAAAAASDSDQDLDGVLQEAQQIRLEIQQIQNDISEISAIKRDATALGRDVQARAQAIYGNLERLGKLSKDLEERHSSTSVVVRISRSQYSFLTAAFRQAMSEYNEAELMQREYCMGRIQRQAEIMGNRLSRGQIDEMIESGNCNVFTGVVAETRTTRSALNEIETRHKELLQLEGRIKEIHEIFLQIAVLVEEQGNFWRKEPTNSCWLLVRVAGRKDHKPTTVIKSTAIWLVNSVASCLTLTNTPAH